jgi:CheY-like chemotaxis protein
VQEPLVLIVEDDAAVLLFAEDAVGAGGYKVATAAHGAEALKVLEEQIDELSGLITDIHLGAGATGWDVARHARELKADLPVVYMTADSAGEWAAQGVPNSVLVQKPYAPAQLLTAIAALMTAADTSTATDTH